MAKEYPVVREDRGLFPLSELAAKGAEEYGDSIIMRTWTGKGYHELTYSDFADKVHAVARWLINYGIRPGDHVAVLSENRPEWAIAYLATQAAGGVVIPIDRMLPANGIRHILSDSAARLLFTVTNFIEILHDAEPIPTLESMICFDLPSAENIIAWSDVVNSGEKIEMELPSREMEELAAILYTSGTTGHSKGVMLSQKNIMSNVAAAYRCLPLGTGDTFLSVLPVHHSFECTAGFLFPIYCGSSITYARSLKSSDLLDDIKNTNVTIMLAVPLLYEKMHAGIVKNVKKRGAGTEILFNMMLNISDAGNKMNMQLGKKLFNGMREKAGLGSVIYFISGGGPLDPATSRFFNNLGICMLQGFGLTETSPITHLTPPSKIRHECVGMPLPQVECKLVDTDESGVGEVCIKGPNVFGGYYQDESASKQVMDGDWFFTGDLGIVHSDDFLQITGRKKNLIVTGGGKNVYPEEIEYLLNRTQFIAESLILGTPRSSGYGEEVAVLVYPDYEQIDMYFDEKGTKPTPEDVSSLIKENIQQAQKELPDYKHIRHFRIVEEEFQKTSTRKIKRFLYSGEMLSVNGQSV